MSQQMTLFSSQASQEDAAKIARLMSGAEASTRALGLQMARNYNLSLLALLKAAIRQNWNRDWESVWDGFERTGRMQFCKFFFGCMEIDIHENEAGQLCFNDYPVYHSGPDDEFSDELTEKYISFCGAHIASNAAYFINNITGTWKN